MTVSRGAVGGAVTEAEAWVPHPPCDGMEVVVLRSITMSLQSDAVASVGCGGGGAWI